MSLSTKDTQMKNTLGKIYLLVFLEILSFADTNLATYSLTTNKESVVVKEAVEVTFQATQKNHSNVMFFFLEPKKSDDYKIELMNKTEEDLSYHNKRTTFTYLLFPLRSGNIKVDFDFTIKVASDEAVAQVYRGSRDNVKWIDTIDTKVKLKPIILHTEDIKNNTQLVGDFTIISKLKNDQIKAYESLHVTYYLKGTGYDKTDIDLIDKIDGISIFKDVTEHYNKATKDGYLLHKEFNYALVGDKNFSIKAKQIHCYSAKQKQYYTIQLEPYNIKVDSTSSETLIDKQEYPTDTYDFEGIIKFFVYISIFISGFITAKIMPRQLRLVYKKEKFDDIKKSKTPKELLLILINNYAKHNLEKSYCDLENLLYKESHEKSFKSIKKEILESLK